ncbi:MAG TPA: NrfD/PsrC family molybdoenzyme membrane anchor subunit [Myxococcales bacterium]|jgi:molybdopterin-containing oxidoreductase family membrane subunit
MSAPIVDPQALAELPGLLMVSKGDSRLVTRGKRTLQVLLPIALLGAAAGVVALFEGHHVMGTTSEIGWGALIATYVFFAVSSTGLCLVSSLGHVFGFKLFEPVTKPAIFLAWVMLTIGFGVIGTELEHPFLLVRWVLLSPNPRSPIWWMGTLYGIYFTFLTAELFFLLKDDHHRARQAAIPKLVAAVAASSTLGAVFALNHSRPFWYGPVLPLYLLVTALVAGASLITLVVYFKDFFGNDGKVREQNVPLVLGLGKLLLLFIGLLFVVTAVRVVFGVNGEHQHLYEVTQAMLSGPLFFSFWFFEVFLAMVVPAVLLLSARGKDPRFVAMAASLPLMALLVMRYNMVYAGQAFSLKPVVGHLGEVLVYGPPFKGNVAGFLEYTPSLVEVGIVAGAVAGAILLFVAGARAFRLLKEV